MNDNLYDEFYDPTEDFRKEPRYFCYEIATQLVNKARANTYENWYESKDTIKGILLLLFTWNFAAKQTKKLNFQNVGQLLMDSERFLKSIEKYSIINAEFSTWKTIEIIFDKFSKLLGQTGSSKALSLLNPALFVMWDTSIRKRINMSLIPGIQNGTTGKQYVLFLKGIQSIIDKYHISEKLPKNSIVAKKIDEYNYVKLVLSKNVVPNQGTGTFKLKSRINSTIKNDFIPKAEKISIPSNLRGRSILKNVIPTVCNLKNMLNKLVIVNGNVELLKSWEKRSYDAYKMDKIKSQILSSHMEDWGELLRNHILNVKPLQLGASCMDIYLVAYVAENYGIGKSNFFRYIKSEGISQKDNTAQAIWQVGKADGIFLNILNKDGSIKDIEFFLRWVNGENEKD